ncbi:MAG: tetraacyldisaccharide 4'-kinase [Porphyromonadaceae bacterium]|nr:tetraacyldisaccharide 4'-kinase [Porphyromonadaceae bacterium]
MTRPDKNILFYLFSVLYGGITEVRNFLFDKNILKSVEFSMPIICVGNLAVGGTGKTPHTEFLLCTLAENHKTAVLSRGYKRETKGFLLADENTSAKQIGDEPFQIFSKFPDTIVAVDEKRVNGVLELTKMYPEIEVIILDDAFQHRHIRPGLNILLTDFNLLFTEDSMLPYGTLRESPKNSKRADIVIVTKCPNELEHIEKEDFKVKLKLQSDQEIFFSAYEYGEIYSVFREKKVNFTINEDTSVMMVTGIENPKPMAEYLNRFTDRIIPFQYPDHHRFSESDLRDIEGKFNEVAGEKVIITTEKDAARLKSEKFVSDVIKNNLFGLPLRVKILNNEQEILINKIYDYVRKNSTNS